MKTGIAIVALVLSFALLAPSTYAQNAPGGMMGGRQRWRAMRQEMIAACANKSAGMPCSFARAGNPVNGTCAANRRGRMICRSPKHRGHGGTGDAMGRAMGGPMGGGAGAPMGGPMPPSGAPQP